MRTRLISGLFLIALLSICPPAWAKEVVNVFAAASTKPVLDALIPVLKGEGITLRVVHAGSSTLARQIEQGAPADIFLSANMRWMDYLIDVGQIETYTKRQVAHNRLVLISGPDPLNAPKMAFGSDYPLDVVLENARLAVADPDHVPAGIYAHEALGSLKLWHKVQGNMAHTLDVTSALMMVARGEARLGIVYATDVRRSKNIQVFATFPETSHSPITYLAAIIKNRTTDAAQRVLDVLSGPAGRLAFAAAGFGTVQ